MPITVAIVGRPNVGKSTLFNRLVGRRAALVDDTPGLTRDRREAEARIGDLQFTLIDTAGFEEADKDTLTARMQRQTQEAVARADLVLLMVDARAGLTPIDREFARLLRRSGRPVSVLANKAESRAADAGITEAFDLGFGQPIPVSAEHNLGLADLHAIISRAAEGTERTSAGDAARAGSIPAELTLVPEIGLDSDAPPQAQARALNLTVVGRPNVGKSTLINALVGSERVLTGPEPGITRDAIVVPWRYGERDIRLFDTAGIRRRARVTDRLEKLSVTDALRAIRYAEVVVLLLDATRPFDKQDLQLADLVEREGRAPVIAVNKWDLVPDKKRALHELRESAERLLPQLRGVPLVPVSALKQTGVPALMRAVFAAEKLWNTRVPTPALNRWLGEVVARHPPPAIRGRRLKLRYLTQAKTRPPGFVLFCSRPDALPADYRRFLVNSMREVFRLDGVPIRLHVRGGVNPYAGKRR